MRIAISVDGQQVAPHFGRCEAYAIVDIEEGEVTHAERVPNPGHEPGALPRFLAERGVQCIVAGGMGPRAHGLFAERRIATIVGVSGAVSDAVEALRRGELQGGESTCTH